MSCFTPPDERKNRARGVAKTVDRTPSLGHTQAIPGSEGPSSRRSVQGKAGLAQKLIRASKRFLRGVWCHHCLLFLSQRLDSKLFTSRIYV